MNCLLSTGVVPANLEIVKICPVYKNDNNTNVLVAIPLQCASEYRCNLIFVYNSANNNKSTQQVFVIQFLLRTRLSASDC